MYSPCYQFGQTPLKSIASRSLNVGFWVNAAPLSPRNLVAGVAAFDEYFGYLEIIFSFHNTKKEFRIVWSKYI